MSWRVFLGLVACNAVWALHPSMGKLVLRDFSPMHTSWLRYVSAFVTSLVLVACLRWTRPRHLSSISASLPHFRWILTAGFVTFFLSPFVQYQGLSLSTASANSIIVAIEPLFAVLLAWLFLKERLAPQQIAAFLIAVCGFLLLSNIRPGELGASFEQFNTGNLLLLVAMPSEAMYSIASRKLAGRVAPITFFALALPVGFAVLTAYLWLAGHGFPSLKHLTWASAFALFWLGPLGTTITYIFWTLALIEAPVAAVALTLFIQPILGVLTGAVFLGEHLGPWQSAGGLMILIALYLQTNLKFRRSYVPSHDER